MDSFQFYTVWGRLASTWVQKQWEQAEAHVDLVKNVHYLVANNNELLAA